MGFWSVLRMVKKINKIELLVPAGDFERLKVAAAFGADAVYMGGTAFGLRAKAKNFDHKQMAEAIEYAKTRNVKTYITANIFAHNKDFEGMGDYFKQVENMGADALIISDPGVFSLAKEVVPKMPLHISTQANNTNYHSVAFWAEQGASRVILARELSLEEIADIHAKIAGKIELEAFIHGSVCMAYSGRCFLSAYMNDRDANKGECSNNCRFKYHLMEEKRQGEYFPVISEDEGTYILNSKDLCMIQHIPEVADAGVTSFKIEGRMKTPHYVATVTKAYRKAIDDFYENYEYYNENKSLYMEEIMKSSNRDFSTGFYFGRPGAEAQIFDGSTHNKTYDFVGIVKTYDAETGFAVIEQRNKFCLGDELEFLRAHKANFSQEIIEMYDNEGNAVTSAPHAQQILKIKVGQEVEPFDIVRMKLK